MLHKVSTVMNESAGAISKIPLADVVVCMSMINFINIHASL